MENLLEKYLLAIVVTLLGFLAPIHTIMLAVGVLIFGDMILGVWAAKKQGRTITSARLRDTVSKMFIYHLVLIMGFVVEKWLLNDFIPIAKLTASVIGVVEMKSVYENAGIILGHPLFSDLILKLGSKNQKE